MDKKYITKNYKETQKLGEDLAKNVLALRQAQDKNKSALVFALQGDLGGGKTTFLQGFAKGLGVKEKILSPTFVIMKCFQLPSLRGNRNCRSNLKVQIASSPEAPRNDDTGFKNFYHFDCYRLKNEKDVLELGFREIISNPENIVAIEWPEKIKKVLPKTAIKIKFKFINKQTRELTIKK